MRVTIDPLRCVCTGYCVRIAAQVFALRDNGPTEVIQPNPTPDLADAAREAADLCPVLAIRITENGE